MDDWQDLLPLWSAWCGASCDDRGSELAIVQGCYGTTTGLQGWGCLSVAHNKAKDDAGCRELASWDMGACVSERVFAGKCPDRGLPLVLPVTMAVTPVGRGRRQVHEIKASGRGLE